MYDKVHEPSLPNCVSKHRRSQVTTVPWAPANVDNSGKRLWSCWKWSEKRWPGSDSRGSGRPSDRECDDPCFMVKSRLTFCSEIWLMLKIWCARRNIEAEDRMFFHVIRLLSLYAISVWYNESFCIVRGGCHVWHPLCNRIRSCQCLPDLVMTVTVGYA